MKHNNTHLGKKPGNFVGFFVIIMLISICAVFVQLAIPVVADVRDCVGGVD